MNGQQTVLHKLLSGKLGTAVCELLLSSDFGIEMTSVAIGGGLRREAGRATIQHAVPLKQHADHAITMQSPCNHHAITMQSPCNHHAITMQSPCRPCNHHAITMQSPCNHHAITMQSPCNHHAITMQSPCNHHAIPMQSPCNHHADHAITMQVLRNPLMLQRTLSSTERVIHKTTAMLLQGTHSLLHKSYSTSCRFGR